MVNWVRKLCLVFPFFITKLYPRTHRSRCISSISSWWFPYFSTPHTQKDHLERFPTSYWYWLHQIWPRHFHPTGFHYGLIFLHSISKNSRTSHGLITIGRIKNTLHFLFLMFLSNFGNSFAFRESFFLSHKRHLSMVSNLAWLKTKKKFGVVNIRANTISKSI